MYNYDDFEIYMCQEEPDKQYRGAAWATAIGLQEVDGLTTSKYLRDTALRNIQGEISMNEARELINSYYERKDIRASFNSDTEQADKVSANIAAMLGEEAFVFSPAGLISIHRRIFQGVFAHAGRIREYNITKREWVLDGDTVLYSPASEILPTLEYDFGLEKKFSYRGLDIDAVINHIIEFISGIWQIHPFEEGNTRTTAVFLIKFLRSLGYYVDNKPFAENSWYFRNALVRANVKNPSKGIEQTDEYLKRFFENLLKGTNHELKNRYMHIRFVGEELGRSPVGIDERLSDRATEVARIVKDGPKSRGDIMKALGLNHIPTFRKNYLRPALEAGIVERTIPEKPTVSNQKYRLTDKGKSILG